ncbi:hypothetical protein [Gluconacetobacter sp.]|uniref:hypothetical protein n=1 Tax=Gluconacetobacter sp. TaxID=1935994 RepID=UPI0039EAAE64
MRDLMGLGDKREKDAHRLGQVWTHLGWQACMRHGPLRKQHDNGSVEIGGLHGWRSIEVKQDRLNGQKEDSIHAVCDDKSARKTEGHQ